MPFTLSPGSWTGRCVVGDLRNKFAKIERDERHRQYLLRKHPLKPQPKPAACECGLTFYEARLWQSSDPKFCKPGIYCLVCAPLPLKQLLIGDMVNKGIRYDADEHGDGGPTGPDAEGDSL